MDKTAGATVAGATVNTSGVLTVRATAVGADTALAQIASLVAAAQAGKGQAQRLADRISAVFVPAVMIITVTTFTGWWLIGGNPLTGLIAAVAVLIVACPCAPALATPVAIMAGTGRSATLGILIKGVEVLERTRKITTVVFDKTGTGTTIARVERDAGVRARCRRAPRRPHTLMPEGLRPLLAPQSPVVKHQTRTATGQKGGQPAAR